MFHKAIIKWILVSLICVFINACSTINGSRAGSTNEKQAELYLQMGVRYLEMNKLKTAKEKLETSLAFDSKNAEIHNALGVLTERLKQYDIAREYYQDAFSRDSKNASINNNYGRFLCDRGEYDKGKNLLKQALAMPLNNRKWFAFTNIGRCELRQGQQQLAESNFRQALQQNSRYSPALFEMQKISYRDGKYMSARAFLERYLAVANHNEETLWYAVQTERVLGNKELSEEYRDKLLIQFPASKQAQQLKTAIR
ncbi:MAG: type IV pilus biogenesis/stability protein PilW [Methylococcaceae bacterium]